MTELKIDIDKLKELGITPQQYFLAKLIFTQDKEALEWLSTIENDDQITYNLYKLYQKGYLDLDPEVSSYVFHFDSMKVNIFDDQVIEKDEFTVFMDEWYALWPKGVKTGGYLVRSGLSDCAKKMKKFMKEHKNFTKEIIFDVTRKYIHEFKKKDYDRMQLAGYFISKDGKSTLESSCEAYLDNPDKFKIVESNSFERRL